ncbi:MAG: asparaginase [Anaerolineae bacterium]|nr:asparaginase [Anaerolineae bacterium]
MSTRRPHIAIVTTGGTIAMRHDPQAGGGVPALEADDLIRLLPELPVTLESAAVCNLPGPHMTPETMWATRETVARFLSRPDVDGVVVTHGTDTLEETATLLDLTLDSTKPVVLTGAMRHASQPSYDGPANLAAAIRVAASVEARGLGALVVLDDTIHAARHVTKMHTQALSTFRSGQFGPLGVVDAAGVYIAQRVRPRPVPCSRLETDAALLMLAAGSSPELFNYLVERGVKGIVLAAMGGGRVPVSWLDPITSAVRSGVLVVIATRVPQGRVGDPYGFPGCHSDLKRRGCLFAGDLNAQKARIALMVALGAADGDVGKARALWPGLVGWPAA